jgi:hypothetical protein
VVISLAITLNQAVIYFTGNRLKLKTERERVRKEYKSRRKEKTSGGKREVLYI